MCGITGAFGETDAEINSLLDTMVHRGPDGQDTMHWEQGFFGHVRLAIVDVEGGKQPLSDTNDKRWLVCNGEIYNHEDLREDHTTYPFKTDSDNEIIFPLYEREGVEAVKQLDGMFAFALWDGTGLYMARDPLGIKPLYYGYNNGAMYFGSEIKVLRDKVEEVREFPPGHWYHSDHGFVPYYSVASVIEDQEAGSAPSLEEIRAELRDAVHKRLMSDVPLGVFLSGGIDSSIIAALVAEKMDNFHSFNVGLDVGGEDRKYARMVSEYLGTQHHEYFYTQEEILEALPEIIYHLESYDPALVRSAIPNYFLARLASQHVTVVLSGEGADELLSGYHYLKEYKTPQELRTELIRITDGLHDCNLQRLDRMTMAHGLEGRVPFLDTEFIAQASAVQLDQKIDTKGIEKWALRKAFEGMLPDEVIWRKKMQFATGAGSDDLIAQLADEEISDAEFERESREVYAATGREILDKEELYFFRIFRDFFGLEMAPIVRRWR
jgi:asparagine synthase (glutamine-hydrolysing)